MLGRVATNEVCPRCGGAFAPALHPLTKDTLDLSCPSCNVRPKRFYIDARGFGLGKLYSDHRGVPFDSFLAAHRQLEEMRRQHDNGTLDESRYEKKKAKEARVDTEVSAWLAWIKRDRGVAYLSTARSFMQKYFVPRFGKLQPGDIRRRDLDAFTDSLREGGLSAMSIKGYVGLISSFYGWLREEKRILPERIPSMPRVSVPYKDRGWIDRRGQAAILAAIPERHRLIFEVLVETGIRPGEAAGLKVRDLYEGMVLIERSIDKAGKVKETKTGKVWYKPVPEELFRRLEAFCRGRFPDEFIFRTPRRKPYTVNVLSWIWREAAGKVGLRISLYPGTRRSHVAQMRKRDEDSLRGKWADAIGDTEAVAMTHYAARRDEVMSVGCPNAPEDTANHAK